MVDSHTLVIVGAGAAGTAVAASLRSRNPSLDIALIDPASIHYYQPGWTMVGGGIFNAPDTARDMSACIPPTVSWIRAAVTALEPERNELVLDSGRRSSRIGNVRWRHQPRAVPAPCHVINRGSSLRSAGWRS